MAWGSGFWHPLRAKLARLVAERTQHLEQSLRALAEVNQRLAREIQERQTTEAALRQESSLNTALVRAQSEIGDGIALLEAERIVFVNEAFCRLCGLPPESLLTAAHPFQSLFLTEDRDLLDRQYLRLLGGTKAPAPPFEARLRHHDGHVVDVLVAMALSRSETQHTVVLELRDLAPLKNYEADLRFLATHDPLTGLANRQLFGDLLQHALSHAERQHTGLWVVLIDLDHFKDINDSLGHQHGEQVLQTVAKRLRGGIRSCDILARFGGDEFGLLLCDQAETDFNFPALPRILAAIHQPLTVADQELSLTASLGCAVYPQDGRDAATLLRNADLAMYRAKELGRDNFQFFTAELDARIHHRLTLATHLRQALDRRELELHYQPQIELSSGRLIGMEALLRWRHPERGLVSPGEFIPLAEETGLIVPIGEWVLTEACRQNQAWRAAGLPALPVAVNLSARQLAQPDLATMVEHALHVSGLPARYLELELTESLSMAQPDQTIPLMHRLKGMGVALAIDDFGTGYSNLAYLARFPVDKLKLDMSFVREMTANSNYLAIATVVIVLAHQLKLKVLAEGVETAAQLALLAANGCDQVQGYFYHPPLTVDAMTALLRQGQVRPPRNRGMLQAAH